LLLLLFFCIPQPPPGQGPPPDHPSGGPPPRPLMQFNQHGGRPLVPQDMGPPPSGMQGPPPLMQTPIRMMPPGGKFQVSSVAPQEPSAPYNACYADPTRCQVFFYQALFSSLGPMPPSGPPRFAPPPPPR